MTQSGLAAIVVTYNQSDLIERCLDALWKEMGDRLGGKVIVVDVGSSDATAEKARRHLSSPRVVTLEAVGRAAGINEAIRLLDEEHADVLVLEPANLLEEDAVVHLAEALQDPGIGISVPRVVDEQGQPVRTLRRSPTGFRILAQTILTRSTTAARHFDVGEVVMDEAAYDERTRSSWASGAPILISSACRTAVGPWDERYLLGAEMTDYLLRAQDLGFALELVPEALSTRAVSSPGIPDVAPSGYGMERIRLQRRRRGLFRTIPFAIATFVSLLGNSWIRSRTDVPSPLTDGPSPGTSFAPPGSTRRSRDYLLFAGLDWWYHSRAHSDFQLFRNIAQTSDVLVVNSIGMRMPTPRKTAGTGRRIIRKLASVSRLMRKPVRSLPGFNVLSPLVFPLYASPLGRRLNATLVALQVRVSAAFAGISNPIVVTTLPTAVDVVDRIPSSLVVYNRSDKHSSFAEAEQSVIEGLEQRLLTEADLVVYSSRKLMEEDSPWASGRQLFLDHGVDLDHFDPSRHLPEPDDIKDIPRPRVGFFGGLADYVVDFDLIGDLAERLEDAQIVLIGDQKCSDEVIARITGFDNLTWLGFKPYEDIPAYGLAFDVAIMPWQNNDWIERCNPIKLKEYLALGLPVVSTGFPELDRYSDVVSIATDRDDFVNKVAAALNGAAPGSPQSRRGAVMHDSWDRRAKELMAAVESLSCRNS